MMNPKNYFTQEHTFASEISEILRKKILFNSILRLLFFIGIFLVFFLMVQYSVALAIILASADFIAFLYLVVRHVHLQQKKNYHDAYKKVTESELKACEHNFDDFRDGEEYINHRHEYSFDLDIFGKGSIFQMLNRTITQMGDKQLANFFHFPVLNKELIKKTQAAIKELSNMPAQLLHFRATGKTSEIGIEDKEQITQWASTVSFVHGNKVLRILSFALPILIFSATIAAFIDSSLSTLVVILFLINMSIIGTNARKINKEHNQVSNFLKVFQKYHGLLTIINDIKFNSELLAQLSGELTHEGNRSDVMLKKLTKSVSAFDNRLNIMAAIFLEGFLLWDLHCLHRIEKWRVGCGQQLPVWLEKVSYFDALVSLGSYSFLHPDFTYPEISEDSILVADQLGHPLIPSDKRVNNNFRIEKKGEFVIITGANMAGKSTFLRTVGVNLVMAAIGIPVCASKFSFKPMKLFTSMRTSDSLRENESYFYAELRRLKEMLDMLEKGEELFIILDEILKGTNSVDKQKGSQSALEKIVRLKGTGIIATHDLALASMADEYPLIIKNQCFEIEIDNAQIFFDYKLYQGVTKKMNALLLMQQMGIIE